MESNTALVLGATGGIGGEMARQLRDAGWTVRALRRSGEQQIERRDAMNREDVLAAAEGCSVIVHAVNPPGYRRWGELVLPMLDNTIAAAHANGVSASAIVISSASRTLARGWSWFHLKPAVDNYRVDASGGPPFFERMVGIAEPSGEAPSSAVSLTWAAAAFLVCSRALMRPLASCVLWRKR